MLLIPLASVAVFLAMLVVAASASAADGTGTVTVAPTYVINSSTGNFLTFTYTATGAGMNNGALTFTVPAGGSALGPRWVQHGRDERGVRRLLAGPDRAHRPIQRDHADRGPDVRHPISGSRASAPSSPRRRPA